MIMRHQAVTIHDIRDRVLAFDLIDILRIAGPDAESSSWRCRNVECTGDLAEELHRASDAMSALTGAEMLRLAGGVLQIIDGDFEAYSASETRPWLVVRAIDSSEYGDHAGRAFARARPRAVPGCPRLSGRRGVCRITSHYYEGRLVKR